MRTRSPTSMAYLRFIILPCARRGRSWTVNCASRAAMPGVAHKLSVALACAVVGAWRPLAAKSYRSLLYQFNVWERGRRRYAHVNEE